MEQLETEVELNNTDFGHQIEQPGTTSELSLHYGDAEDGDSAPGYSGDGAIPSEQADESILAEGVLASRAVEDTSAMTVEAAGSGPVKRKRGRPRKNPEARTAPLVKKKERENVCFVCFDPTNQNLVSCNKRGCYKAYHPACVNREEDFFHSKVKWNCGWHICSNCQKAAHYMCYTCTTSYCKECITDESKYVCVRGNYGFCQSCHNTVTLIELNKLSFEKKDGSDFDDTDSFTYLFKAYWLDQKRNLAITSEELNNARHPFSVALDESSDELYDANEDRGSSSESSSGHHKNKILSKKNGRSRSHVVNAHKSPVKDVGSVETATLPETGWASKELLELVAHMRNGDQSLISQFEVQALLLDYIKKYNLRDPRRKSQIICDLRLRNLFGKERVGHFEMLKLLESHFLSKEGQQVSGEVDQVEASELDNKLTEEVEEADTYARSIYEKKRKYRKKNEEIEPQTNIDDYAAVDVHNVTQIFLRRNLIEELLDDIETFDEKVVGSFVRIRISNAGQRQDLYRLVQVVGIQENPKPYKVGKKTTSIALEILNLDKKEISTIDTISNQDFTEEECQRLRQSIKCGLIDRLKVGYIQEKAKVLHVVRVNDLIEAEKLKLIHLRDRASETGRRKQLRECVEKLQLLNSQEERRRRLNEVPRIHADPKMDPQYESLEETEEDKNKDFNFRSKEALSMKMRRELIPRGRAGNNWNGPHRSPNFNHESSRKMHFEAGQDTPGAYNNMTENPNVALLNQSKETHQSEPSFIDFQTPSPENLTAKLTQQPNNTAPSVNSASPNEVEKIWHYVDPSNVIQGPFSITQLRKWSTTGYFPPDMRTWRKGEKREDSCLLSDVLSGRFLTHQQTSATWNAPQSINQPNGPIYDTPYHNPPQDKTGRAYGNLWSPTRLTNQDKLMSDPTVGSTSGSNERKYRSFESDCPSPTPKTENAEISQGSAAPLRPLDSSLAPRPGITVFETPNTASASKFSPIGSNSEETVIRTVEARFASMDHSSLLDQAQNSNPNFSPIHQLNLPNAVQVDTSFPSPTPKSSNSTWGIDPAAPSQAVQSANTAWVGPPQGNPGWVPPPNPGWGAPGQMSSNVPIQMNTNANTGWATPLQGHPSANTGWGTPAQVNMNANAGWGAPVQVNANANTGWGTPVQLNSSANTGWGTPAPANMNPNTGWRAPAPTNTNPNTCWVAPGLVNTNPNTGWRAPGPVNTNPNSGWRAPAPAMPMQENGANARVGWGSLYGGKETGRRVDHEGGNGEGYSHPRSAGRHGGDGPRGVCRFFENGHCKKGRHCTYLHTDTKRNNR